MAEVTLGRTNITVDRNGFGALPLQRIPLEDAVKLLQKAYEGGITFFDTARAYTDSEEKLGHALSGVRPHVFIATKTAAENANDFQKDLEASLSLLKTDYLDIYQFHNPAFCPQGKRARENPFYRHYQPSPVRSQGSGRIRALRHAPVSFLLPLRPPGAGTGAVLRFPVYWLYRHEIFIGGPDHQLGGRLCFRRPIPQCPSHMGHPKRTGTGRIFKLYP